MGIKSVYDETKLLLGDGEKERVVSTITFLGLKYPRSIFFIVSNEFCERFSYYGMKTVLSLYLTTALSYDKDTATVFYHLFAMLCYFFPLFGAIIADSVLGKFRTILYLSIIYAIGNIILSTASIPVIDLPHRGISLLGLLFIAIGTGGIKPCVSAFGGDQFVLPEQERQLQRFFSIFYFSINSGSMISTFLTPSLRNDVKCFGQESCFPLAFGVPAVLMVISVVVFMAGKSMYKIQKPSGNVIAVFINCIARAIKNKVAGKNNVKKNHWLEYADDKYSEKQISDIRAVLSILYLFIPLPFFWALYDQQGSRWTFQATNMDGRLWGYTIKPDQMQVLNPIFILGFIPLFEVYIYPALKTVGIRRPLQKLVIGGFLAALAFGCSTYLETQVQKSYVVEPTTGTANLRIFNSLECTVKMNPPIEHVSSIKPLSGIELLRTPVDNSKEYKITFSIEDLCPQKLANIESNIIIAEKEEVSYFVSQNSSSLWVARQPDQFDELSKDDDGAIKLRFFYSSSSLPEIVNVKLLKESDKTTIQEKDNIETNVLTGFILINAGTYNVLVNNKVVIDSLVLNPGEIDTILFHRNASDIVHAKIIDLAPSNKVHMLWQVPQICIMTAGEIMFSITGLEFSFTQAPENMKSVLAAVWLLTIAFGNLIVVVISEIKFFDSQVYEFLLFTVLMLVDVFCLIFLSMRYKYNTYRDTSETSSLHTRPSNSQVEGDTQMTSISTLND